MTIAMGGGSGAVAASAHAGCERYRLTDTLITGLSRRALASELGTPDSSGVIPQARWTRAMAFETMVRTDKFAARIATTSAGQLRLQRPKSVVNVDAGEDVERTEKLLTEARLRAEFESSATFLSRPAVTTPGFAAGTATYVLPDFVVVLPKGLGDLGAWVVVGDVKDYERIRSRIDDARMLKGFLQVAFGAEAFQSWTKLPSGLEVHRYGVLAVPRNSFLHPVAVTEDLLDHRREVKMRLAQRVDESQSIEWTNEPLSFVEHLNARFDPATCTSCSLFNFCRDELRSSDEPLDLLVEIGVPRDRRNALLPLLSGGEVDSTALATWVSRVVATISGEKELTGRRRLDPVGLPGTVELVLARSDSAALGVHGVSIRVVDEKGRTEWKTSLFSEPQTDAARRGLFELIGEGIETALEITDRNSGDAPVPVHIVVPDRTTADLLASIADVLAGAEVSRLRYIRDIDKGREPLTFDGEPATVPEVLTVRQRLAVSFLLEDDRARGFSTRIPVVDLSSTLNRYVVAGGPLVDSSRLDYVVAWCETDSTDPVNFRALSDSLELSAHTPGAKLSRETSDELHEAMYGQAGRTAHPERYDSILRDELAYKCNVFDRAVTAIEANPISNLRVALRTAEGDAQAVWRRRYNLQAFDLIRFGRTNRLWRNQLVQVVQNDKRCSDQIGVLTDPSLADERSRDAGTKEIAIATVVSVDPLEVRVRSRRFTVESSAVILHVNGVPTVERDVVTTDVMKGAIRVNEIPAGPFRPGSDPDDPRRFQLELKNPIDLSVRDELVLAELDWLDGVYGGKYIKVVRPALDSQVSPKVTCEPESFTENPEEHQWCCRPHVDFEAMISDLFAAERASGEMNPVVWPPIRDEDEFDISTGTDPIADVSASPVLPDGLTVDDVE